jgi:hypothetical protein
VGGQSTSEFSGFSAYVRDVAQTSLIDVYAISGGDKSVCHVATVMANKYAE